MQTNYFVFYMHSKSPHRFNVGSVINVDDDSVLIAEYDPYGKFDGIAF